MTEQTQGSYSPDVITRYVWDAVQHLPGIVDLYRNPLQSLGEKVHLERVGPVRLESTDAGTIVHIHIVIGPDAQVPQLAASIRDNVAAYLERMTGIRALAVNVHVDDIAWETPPAT